MDIMHAKEFLTNAKTGYQYGMFYQEEKSKYYISEETIDYVLDKIEWELNDSEKKYVKQWRQFEKIHKNYCLDLISNEEYKRMINEEYNLYAKENGYDFGECCDELTNHILRYLK